MVEHYRKDKRSYLEECEEVLRVMDMALYNCNDKKKGRNLLSKH